MEAYGNSFSQGARAVASFYSEPCVTARIGNVRVNPTRRETEALFVQVDEDYRARGFTHGAIVTMEVQLLGSNSAFATVRWAYKNAREETAWDTTFSYNLYRRDGAWKILVQTMHDS
jgi:hypothetical protein